MTEMDWLSKPKMLTYCWALNRKCLLTPSPKSSGEIKKWKFFCAVCLFRGGEKTISRGGGSMLLVFSPFFHYLANEDKPSEG